MQPPPLGVIPRDIHRDQRITELNRAIVRYIEANMEVPIEWVEERNELLASVKS